MTPPSDTPADAERTAVKRGATIILVGFVLTVVARIIFHGAQLTLDAGALSGASGMRPPNAPDPDFMLLLPFLGVLLVAKLIEAYGKLVCLSRPERLNYVPIHLSLACDLAAVVGLVLRLFNFGRTAGPILPWISGLDLVGLAAMLPIGYFARRSAQTLGVPSLRFWARFNLIATTLVIVAGARPEWWLKFMAVGHLEWQGALAVLFVVASAAVGSYVAILAKIVGQKLAATPAGGST